MTYITNKRYWTEVAAGEIPDAAPVNQFGINTDVDKDIEEDVWDKGGIWVKPTGAQVHDLVSTDAGDNQTIHVYGLDSSGDEHDELVVLNGTTTVSTVTDYITIFEMVNEGPTDVAGTVTATAQTDGTVTAQITGANNQTLMAVYTVPSGKIGLVSNYYASVQNIAGPHGSVGIKVLVRPLGQVWQLKHFMSISSTATNYSRHEFNPELSLASGSDIKISAIASASDLEVSAGFDMVLR
jgi:hypothetical protein